jgi:hypothetical protein
MANYFSYLPNIRVGIPEQNSSIKNYVEIKNLFRRVKFRTETLRNLTYFEKYSIPGDDKPYNVSYNFYQTPKYEWVILLLNDITNVYTQWPLSQREFEIMISKKYGTQSESGIHHWETNIIKDLDGNVVVPAGMVVSEDFTRRLGNTILSGDELVTAVSYYEYEERLNESKRQIYLPYPDRMFAITNELTSLLQYYSSVDTKDLGNDTKNSGDDDFYTFKYFTSGISK